MRISLGLVKNEIISIYGVGYNEIIRVFFVLLFIVDYHEIMWSFVIKLE